MISYGDIKSGEAAPPAANEPSLVRYDAACRALAEAKSVDDVKDIRDRSEAMRAYARQAKNKQLEVDAAEIRIRAERRLGEMIADQRATVGLNTGSLRRGSQTDPRDDRPTLADAGIDKHLADRARKLAAIPEAEFTEIVSDWRERVERENERVSVNLLKTGERHAAAQAVDTRAAPERDADAIQSPFDRAGDEGRALFLARNNLQFQAKASEDNGATGKATMRRADSMAGEVSRSTPATNTGEGDGRDVEAFGGAASVTTNSQSDGNAFVAVKGMARLANAAGVEPSPSDTPSATPAEAAPASPKPPAHAGAVDNFLNPRCQKPETCKWAHSQASCSACSNAAMKARAA
ncbi:hypothetical protein [Aquamicrobium terrae]|uniref:C3H1-type domain-containing protein n=1 Tax=Aquamicrobium terrae TaxID=1324945 RepID=A0ABV2MV69_9HYPH